MRRGPSDLATEAAADGEDGEGAGAARADVAAAFVDDGKGSDGGLVLDSDSGIFTVGDGSDVTAFDIGAFFNRCRCDCWCFFVFTAMRG